MTTTTNIKDRVIRGADYLDLIYMGPSWADSVDLDKLAMLGASTCVLGQLAAVADPDIWGWTKVKAHFRLTEDQTIYLGLQGNVTASDWRPQIEARQTPKPTVKTFRVGSIVSYSNLPDQIYVKTAEREWTRYSRNGKLPDGRRATVEYDHDGVFGLDIKHDGVPDVIIAGGYV